MGKREGGRDVAAAAAVARASGEGGRDRDTDCLATMPMATNKGSNLSEVHSAQWRAAPRRQPVTRKEGRLHRQLGGAPTGKDLSWRRVLRSRMPSNWGRTVAP